MAEKSRIRGISIGLDLETSQLNRSLGEVRRSFKELNGSLKTNLNNFKYTEKSADSYEQAISDLTNTIKAQKKNVGSLKREYDSLVEQGKTNTIHASNVRQEYNRQADSLNMLKDKLSMTKKEFESFSKSQQQASGKWKMFGDQLDVMGDKLMNTGDKMKSVGSRFTLGLTAPIAGAAGAAVKAAGDYDAAASQFTQVFGDLEGEAKKTLDGIAKETGLLPNSLRDSYTMIAAFAKTTGADSKTALDITRRATLAAADSAAFYDRSISDVTDSLQSYLKGNFENDAALGISSTETTRNAKANELYSKSFKDLSEDQKQLTLLAMVEDGNKLSGALGQAARETDQLGTQTGNLKTAVKDMLAEFGKPILPAAVKGIKTLSEATKKGADSFRDLGGFGQGVVLSLAAFAAAIGPTLVGLGTLSWSIGSLMKSLAPFGKILDSSGGFIKFLSKRLPLLASALGMISWPVVAITAAIIGVGAAFVIAYKKSETFRNIVNGIVDSVKNKFSEFIEFLKPVFTIIADTFKSVVSEVMDFAGQIGSKLIEFWNKNGEEIVQALTNIFNFVKGILDALVTVFSVIFNDVILPIIKFAMDTIWGIMKFIWPAIKALIESTWGNIKGVISGALDIILGIVKIFSSLFTGNWSGLWQGIKQLTSGVVQFLWNFINLWFVGKILGTTRVFGDLFKSLFAGIWNGIKQIFSFSLSFIFNTSKNSFTSIFNIGKSLFTSLKNFFSMIWNSIKNIFSSTLSGIWNGLKNNFTKMFNFGKTTFTNLKNTMSNLWNSIRDNTVGRARDMKEKVTGIFNGMKNGIKDHIDTIKGHIGGMTKGVKNGLNKLIGGVNWVGGKLGMDKIPEIKLSTGTGSLTANGKLTQDTFATVGDRGPGNGPGGFRHEMIRYPNGKIAITPNRDTKTFLPKGSEVFNGAQTYSMFSNNSLPRFHNGTKAKKGDNLFSDVVNGGKAVAGKVVDGGKVVVNKTLETAAKGKEWLSDKIGDVMDWIDNPAKLLEKVLDGFGIDMSSFGIEKGASLPFDMMKGMYKKLKDGAIKTFKSWFDEQGGDGGYIDLAKGINFPFSPHGRAPGYPFPYPHMGVDLNYVYDKLYSVMGGKATARGGYNGGFGNMVDIVNGNIKVIYGHMSKHAFSGTKNVKPGDYLGVSGDTGMSSGPHLHLEVQKNGVPIDPLAWLKKNNGGGGASGKWNGDIKKALRFAGLPTTSAYVNAWKQQIQTESGGNARAIGGDDGLADGKAMGLVQVKPGTFNAYKLPGHGNIMNGLDNLIAGMRYAKARYGGSMLSVIGRGHGYATGGYIQNSGWYNLAEGGYPEWVIPTDPNKSSEAMMMLSMAANQIERNSTSGNKRPNQLSRNFSSSNNDELIFQLIQQQQKQIELLMQIAQSNEEIAEKEFVIDKYEHKKQVYEGIDDYNRQKSRKSRFVPSLA